jgi:hypothetical protein
MASYDMSHSNGYTRVLFTEICSLTLKGEHRLRVISEHGEIKYWRKLHNEELHNLCCLPNIAKVMKSRREKSATRMGDIFGPINLKEEPTLEN